jgi:hypothetical protein
MAGRFVAMLAGRIATVTDNLMSGPKMHAHPNTGSANVEPIMKGD